MISVMGTDLQYVGLVQVPWGMLQLCSPVFFLSCPKPCGGAGDMTRVSPTALWSKGRERASPGASSLAAGTFHEVVTCSFGANDTTVKRPALVLTFLSASSSGFFYDILQKLSNCANIFIFFFRSSGLLFL